MCVLWASDVVPPWLACCSGSRVFLAGRVRGGFNPNVSTARGPCPYTYSSMTRVWSHCVFHVMYPTIQTPWWGDSWSAHRSTATLAVFQRPLTSLNTSSCFSVPPSCLHSSGCGWVTPNRLFWLKQNAFVSVPLACSWSSWCE